MRPGDKTALFERLQRLLDDPDSIETWWPQLRGPIFRWFDFEPELKVDALMAFSDHVSGQTLRKKGPSSLSQHAEAKRLADGAWLELETNVSALEKNYWVYGGNAPRSLHWLHQMHALLLAADRTLERRDQTGASAGKGVSDWLDYRQFQRAKRRALAPLTAKAGSAKGSAQQLQSIDALLDAADAEADFLGRRRKLLESARELLLTAAESVVDQAGVQERLEHVGTELGELGRIEASGVRMDVALAHQLGNAVTQRSPRRLNAILSALEHSQMMAPQRGRVSELTQQALGHLWRGLDRGDASHRLRSLAESGGESLSPGVSAAIGQGYERAKEDWQAYQDKQPDVSELLVRHVDRYLDEAPATDLIHASLYVDGCVDVGGVLSPHRVTEVHQAVVRVRQPTQKLELSTAESLDDVPQAVITDPRALLFDLASQRLLTRRYLGTRQVHTERRVMASEVRVFLLDGSGSMLGPRARMRDAIMVAELSTMIARLNDKDRWLTPTLFYRYFNDELGPIHKVQTSSEALAAVEHVLGEVRFGGTDIQGALLESFDTVREAAAADKQLEHAQIVLVTDGEANVDGDRVEAARGGAGDVPIGVSIIALGEENAALRRIATTQRERGQRVFYQFIPDRLLSSMVQGREVSLALHLPEDRCELEIGKELSSVVREIELAARQRNDEALSLVGDEVDALDEVGLAWEQLPETERTRILALNRDHKTLQSRFQRWFPAATEPPPKTLTLSPSSTDEQLIGDVQGMLGAVAEVTELVGGEPHRRQSDAVEMLERLLVASGLSFNEYSQLLDRYPKRFLPYLELVVRVAQ